MFVQAQLKLADTLKKLSETAGKKKIKNIIWKNYLLLIINLFLQKRTIWILE